MEWIGRYRVDSELGRGAMGVVYRGFDPKIGRDVAIKVIRLDPFASAEQKADLKMRFAREAAAAGKLSHANIVTIHDFGEHDFGEQADQQYLVLEMVDGCSLDKTLAPEVRQDCARVVGLLGQVAGALDYAHGKGVVHRDVKPANILVRQDGVAKIADFGIARISDETVTKTGATVGTYSYMAPEQIESGRVNGKADQFSLAVMAYQMLSGRMPFVAAGIPALVYKILNEEPPALRDLGDVYPPRASEVLKKGLAKDPERRYATCAEFVRDLAAALEEPAEGPAGRVAVPAAEVAEKPAEGEQTTELLERASTAPRAPLGDRPGGLSYEPGAQASSGALGERVEKPLAEREGVVSGRRGAAITNRRQVDNLPHKKWLVIGFGAAALAAILLWVFGVFGARPMVAPAPVVAQFAADPGSIPLGQAATLRWQVDRGATGVSIDHGVGTVQNSGYYNVTPRESITYTLTAVGPGGTARASATVSVAPPSPLATEHRVGDSKTEGDGLKYVWIPPGTFPMGCSPGDSECDDDEKPAHQVTITKGFWLGQTDVTQGAYRRVIGTSPSNFKGDNLPVEQVSWNEAQSYCQKIGGGRLPTEAEWEYAARAGSTASRYGALDDIAWTSRNSGNTTHPVGTKQQNAFGLFDMLGNVYQWTADWYAEKYYESSGQMDPTGPAAGTYRTLRGGSWDSYPRDARASYRSRGEPVFRYYGVGFRCVGE